MHSQGIKDWFSVFFSFLIELGLGLQRGHIKFSKKIQLKKSYLQHNSIFVNKYKFGEKKSVFFHSKVSNIFLSINSWKKKTLN